MKRKTCRDCMEMVENREEVKKGWVNSDNFVKKALYYWVMAATGGLIVWFGLAAVVMVLAIIGGIMGMGR